jgi:hypothetical protein
MTVAEMLTRVSSCELTEWAAFYALEPFGEERADLRAGIISATVANVNRGEKQEPLAAADFMPKFDREVDEEMADEEAASDDESEAVPEDPEAWREMLKRVEAMNAAFGGYDLRTTK